MSALTPIWTVDKIREIYRALDQKTGLRGGELPIILQSTRKRLGAFYPSPGHEKFSFSLQYLNDPDFPESEAIQLLRHEYAHYYDYTAKIWKWLPPGRTSHHGVDWKFACSMISALPRRCYSRSKPIPELTPTEAERKRKAEDVRSCDICMYLKNWNKLPLPEKEESYFNLLLEKQYGPYGYYKPGDWCLHKTRGYGCVFDTRPEPGIQLLYVCYKDGHTFVETNQSVYKIEESVVMAPKEVIEAHKR